MASLDTNFNISPYFDDYDEEKNFHRVLFRPAVPVQARELTQLQTILQNQVERFGDNIYKQGTIIQGCTFTYDYNYQFIKIKDLQADGVQVTPAAYMNLYATDLLTNLNAVVVNYTTGLESQDPNTNILYLKYLNTGNSQEKKFSNNSTITLFNQEYRVESVRVDSGGSGYSNDDSLIFTSNTGSGAAANVVTYSNGSIRSFTFTSHGSGYITAPEVTVNTSTGSDATLTALNYVAQVTVANSLFVSNTTVSGVNVATSPVGTGTAVTVSDGIIYQKGHFVRVEEQTVIVDKFTTNPNNVVLGFYTEESIVNSSIDTTLLDNAQGYSNYTAPGAHRLKLTPRIQVLTKADAQANADFFKLVEFEDGRVTKRKTEVEFNSIDKKLSQRTAEESGDYVVSPFVISTEDISGNTTHIKAVIGPGVAYVDGNRIETIDATRLNIRQGTDTKTALGQSIAMNYGNYVLIKEAHGILNFTSGATVNLRNQAAGDVTDNFGGSSTTPGSVIGTAMMRSVEYDSGVVGTADAVYRLYLFNIVMSGGQTFADVKSVQASGGVADVVLNSNNKAVLTDTAYDTLVFPSGYGSVKSVSNVEFVYRTVVANTITTNGNTTIELSGTYEYFPYTVSSTLNTIQEREFIVTPTANAVGATNLTGTVTSSGNLITGTSTAFTSQLEAGDYIKFSGNTEIFRVTAINSDTSISVNGTTGPVVTANTLSRAFPANVPIRLDRGNANVQIDSTGKRAYIYVGDSLNATAAVKVVHNIKVAPTSASVYKIKTVEKGVYVKLSTDSLTASNKGPWCLGIPDVYKINAVYVGTSNTYSNTTTNYSSSFELDSGQSDNLTGLSYLKYKPGSTLSLSNSSCLLVSVDCFTQDTGYYTTTESYPVNDTGTYNSATDIRTSDVPLFKSPKTGSTVSLRDVIDFRPTVANTANVNATTVAGATVDPSNVEVISGSPRFPAPNQIFEGDVERYLARADLILLDRNENITVKEGLSSDVPLPPTASDKSMVLGTVIIPPYPSLSPKLAVKSKRRDLTTLVKTDQVKRYTMKDIKQIESRLKSLEYYSLLNTLEKDTKDLVVPSEADPTISRFKNGFFVESFTSYGVANVDDNEFNFMIDTRKGFGTSPIQHTPIDIGFVSGSSSNVTKTGDIITLTYDDEVALSQQIATRFRNLAGLAWAYNGQLKVFPEYDNYYDTEEQAITFTVDLATPINDLINSINDSVTFKKDSKTLQSVDQTGSWSTKTAVTGEVVQGKNVRSSLGLVARTEYASGVGTYVRETENIGVGETIQDISEVGSFSAISDFNPFIRSQQIYFCVTGLRPGARHYVFFDGVRVDNQYTESGTDAEFLGARQGEIPLSAITSTESLEFNPSFKFIKPQGQSLVANTTGGLAGAFWIPGGRFSVGQREIIVADTDNLDSFDTSVSKASAFFNAYNFSKTNVSYSLATKAPSNIQPKTVTTTFQEAVTIKRTNYYDPLAQTFNINFADGADGCFITKVDLYFKSKSETQGLTVSVRETDNGYPAQQVIARKTVTPSQVNISDTGQTATTVVFDTPIFIRNNKDYALVLAPDSNSPDYLVWTAETGKPDVFTNVVDNGDFGAGVLFISSNDKVWTPIQTEDLKMNIYYAKFNAVEGSAVFNNNDYEFLTLANTEGSFIVGESVAQKSNTYITGALVTGNTSSETANTSASLTSFINEGDNILIVYGTNKVTGTGTVSNTTTTTITGSGTLFSSEYTNGDYLLIGNDVREVVSIANNTQLTIDSPLSSSASGVAHYGVTSSYQVNKVMGISSTQITFKDYLELNVDNSAVYASIQKVVSGRLYKKGDNDTIVLSESNASDGSFLFEASKKIIGSVSDASAVISSVDDYVVNYVEPHISTVSPTPTVITLSQTIAATTGSASAQDISFGASNRTLYEAEVRSRSNEISAYSGQKSLALTATLKRTSDSNKVSPVIDVSPISIVGIKNKINNSFNNETTRYGDAQAKYISKSVTLADGLDAEDMKVFLTAYKPYGTNIQVYAKVLSNDDSYSFVEKDWTLLDQATEAGLYSDLGDLEDYIEYEFNVPLTPPSTVLNGRVDTNSNTTLTGFSTTFSDDLSAGDLIKIVNTSTVGDYEINVVSSVESNTSITLSNAIGPYSNTTATGYSIEKVTQPQAAFKYSKDSGIIRYYDASQSGHTTYKVFAIKVVVLSESSQVVPKIKDIRAMAVSV